jgi:hypothetical protein
MRTAEGFRPCAKRQLAWSGFLSGSAIPLGGRMQTHRRLYMLVLLPAMIAGCYSGDGEFDSHGIWPLSTYSLELPSWQLEDGLKREFEVRGWRSHQKTYLSLNLRSTTPIVFADLPDELTVTITESSGKKLLETSSGIFAHLKKMQDLGETALPSEGQWLCTHAWDNPDVDDRAVPFMPGVAPKPQLSINCWQELQMPDRNYKVSVRCNQCGGQREVTATLRLGSGWK